MRCNLIALDIPLGRLLDILRVKDEKVLWLLFYEYSGERAKLGG